MAWLSVGMSNDDLCDKLVQYGVLKESIVEAAFRITDRGDFVDAEDRQLAYLDRPYKRGPLHLSAPHMYATVLEALDLQRGQAFLNVGSGSGYLNCMASFLLGPEGISHGIEISPSIVQHSRKCVTEWETKVHSLCDKSSFLEGKRNNNRNKIISTICVIEGNCFDLDVEFSRNACLYDRIYVGAGCPDEKKDFFYSLLADNGIMVLPILEKNEMVCIKKLCGKVFCQTHISHVHFAPLLEVPTRGGRSLNTSRPFDDEIEENLSPAMFSVLQDISLCGESDIILHKYSRRNRTSESHCSRKVKLPALTWEPNHLRHLLFPRPFREVVKLIMLSCCRKITAHEVRAMSACSRLPSVIWFQILSFASRDWFTQKKSEAEQLKIELMAERRLRMLAEEKVALLMNGKRTAERERDMLRMVVARLGQRDSSSGLNLFGVPTQEEVIVEDDDDDDSIMSGEAELNRSDDEEAEDLGSDGSMGSADDEVDEHENQEDLYETTFEEEATSDSSVAFEVVNSEEGSSERMASRVLESIFSSRDFHDDSGENSLVVEDVILDDERQPPEGASPSQTAAESYQENADAVQPTEINANVRVSEGSFDSTTTCESISSFSWSSTNDKANNVS